MHRLVPAGVPGGHRYANHRVWGSHSSESGSSQRRGSPLPSVLGKLDEHHITPNDAPDARESVDHVPEKNEIEGIGEFEICCGKHAWWKPAKIVGAFHQLVALSQWDREMKRLVKLSVPFSLSALLIGVVDIFMVAIIAQFLGTEAVAAYTIVDILLGLTGVFINGLLSTEATLCSHAVGAENYKLAGQYVQISAFLYTVGFIPHALFWSFYLDDAIRWFGFSEAVAKMGFDYGMVMLFHDLLEGIGEAYHGLLEVIDREQWSTAMVVAEDLTSTVVVFLVVSLQDIALSEIALIHLTTGIIFFAFNNWYTVYKGWVNPYLEGMVGSHAITVSREVVAVCW
mmetsp:Transcript_3605/g.8012  ORF Transcript_3605/g.8012 Transcript_3605/m.8012 type:complete len:341 (+) Transcript_3605:674-1696(+)